MSPARPSASLLESLRLVAAVLHTVPRAVGALSTTCGATHVVAHHHRQAVLTPCQLRTALLEPMEDGVPRLADAMTSLEIVGGVVDLGGGLFQAGHPAGQDLRWFATTLPAGQVEALAHACPPDVDHSDIDVRVIADVELAVCVVRVGGAGVGLRLDAVACWLHSQCLVEELLSAALRPWRALSPNPTEGPR